MAEKLKQYTEKRNLEKSGEPSGETAEKEKKPEGKLIFAVQHHLARRDHYDFRLEWNGALLSWAVPKGPSYNPKDKRLAVRVEDHPYDYKDFEGTIPKGEYGGGTVMLWDEGFWIPYGDVDQGLKDGSLKFELLGKRLKGKWALARFKTEEGGKDENWLLIKEKDEYSGGGDGISDFVTSIKTGRTMDEIASGAVSSDTLKNPFDNAEAQLAKLENSIPDGKEWIFEVKYDGYRIISYMEDGGVKLITRNGNDFTSRFKSVAESLSVLASGRAMVLDGEMVITDESGKTDFQALQNYIKKPNGKNLTYVIFDILALDGQDLRDITLIKRKEILANIMKNAPDDLWFSKFAEGKGKESFAAACKLELEGIVGKRADSVYSGTRNGDWIKLKCGKRQEFVIGGYTLTDKKTEGLSALLLGTYANNKLTYNGRAGTGFSERMQKELEGEFKPLIINDCPFERKPKTGKNEEVFWLKPEKVAEIKFAEMTDENLLRQASFKGLRIDKDPEDVVAEKAEDTTVDYKTEKKETKIKNKSSGGNVICGITVTNPDKIMYENPEMKKIEVARYYEQAAERMLPYIKGRILSVIRCPQGIKQACFFKKHPLTERKGTVIKSIKNNDGGKDDYFYIDDISGLISEAQMGTLEFHVWGSRAETLEKPDMMVFDLDPDAGMDISQVRQGVKDLKSVLDELKLKSFLKTSGGKGYHIVVPFIPSADWETFGNFAKSVSEVMAGRWPNKYTSNIRKIARIGKIFIDWERNGRGATSVAPYSLRARVGAAVSMPIEWDELDSVTPNGVNASECIKRIEKADPWKDFYKIKQTLKI